MNENFGASELAKRFGVTRYPAVFVEDVLVARPRDFGFFGKGEEGGRYAPWHNAQNHAKFQLDLTRMIDLVLAGKKQDLQSERASSNSAPDEISSLPRFTITDLSGRLLTDKQLADRVVLVEFWATWCPPCRSTLGWLGTLRSRYGDRLAIVAMAVESPEDQVRSTVASLSSDIHWVMPDSATARDFGDVVAVPTMLFFDCSGRAVGALYGSPTNLHELAEAKLDALLK